MLLCIRHLQVGAVLVDRNGAVLGEGWNRMPRGCEGKFPWAATGQLEDTKHLYGETSII
jgi:deoxycytidylate deaminase